jgi:RNA polymerase sigma-70 factor (ECF subfamily)
METAPSRPWMRWRFAAGAGWRCGAAAVALVAAFAALRTRRGDDEMLDPPASRRDGAAVSDHRSLRSSGPSVGDDPEFEAFFTRYERPLYGYLRRLLPSHETALDVAQEAFFRAWQRFDELRGYDRPDAWLYRVATNLALDALRRRQPLRLGWLPPRRRDAADADDTPKAEIEALMAPGDLEGEAVQRDLVDRTLRRLTEHQRAALLLRAGYGFTSDEIATILKTTPANARQLLSRGRARFAELYQRT